MPKYGITGKTAPPKPRHRVTGKTNAFLTDFPAPVVVHAPAAGKKPAVKKVMRECKITIERPGEAPQVYHTRSSNETLPS